MHDEVAEQAQLAFDRAILHATTQGLPSETAIERAKKASDEFLAYFNPVGDENKAEYAKALGRSLAIRDELEHVYIMEYRRFSDSDAAKGLGVRVGRFARAYATTKQGAYLEIISGLDNNALLPSWESLVSNGRL